MSIEGYDDRLLSSEKTWDSMDITMVRSVAWSSLPTVSSRIWENFAGGSGPHDEIRTVIESKIKGQSQDDFSSLHGCALVCGDMESERTFFVPWSGFSFTSVDGFDLSAESLKRVRPTPFEFIANKVDCNALLLENSKYDLVIVSHGAHHIGELINFFEQINSSLKKTGVFYFYEWVGPLALQIPRRNSFFAKLFLITLFRRQVRTTHMGKLKGLAYLQDPPESFDPSEACNSMEILPTVRHVLNLETIYLHGGLTYPIFEGIAQNFSDVTKRYKKRIIFIIRVERLLTAMKLVHPLFAVGIATRKDIS